MELIRFASMEDLDRATGHDDLLEGADARTSTGRCGRSAVVPGRALVLCLLLPPPPYYTLLPFPQNKLMTIELCVVVGTVRSHQKQKESRTNSGRGRCTLCSRIAVASLLGI